MFVNRGNGPGRGYHVSRLRGPGNHVATVQRIAGRRVERGSGRLYSETSSAAGDASPTDGLWPLANGQQRALQRDAQLLPVCPGYASVSGGGIRREIQTIVMMHRLRNPQWHPVVIIQISSQLRSATEPYRDRQPVQSRRSGKATFARPGIPSASQFEDLSTPDGVMPDRPVESSSTSVGPP